jgi:hypothetical protein
VQHIFFKPLSKPGSKGARHAWVEIGELDADSARRFTPTDLSKQI